MNAVANLELHHVCPFSPLYVWPHKAEPGKGEEFASPVWLPRTRSQPSTMHVSTKLGMIGGFLLLQRMFGARTLLAWPQTNGGSVSKTVSTNILVIKLQRKRKWLLLLAGPRKTAATGQQKEAPSAWAGNTNAGVELSGSVKTLLGRLTPLTQTWVFLLHSVRFFFGVDVGQKEELPSHLPSSAHSESFRHFSRSFLNSQFCVQQGPSLGLKREKNLLPFQQASSFQRRSVFILRDRLTPICSLSSNRSLPDFPLKSLRRICAQLTLPTMQECFGRDLKRGACLDRGVLLPPNQFKPLVLCLAESLFK